MLTYIFTVMVKARHSWSSGLIDLQEVGYDFEAVPTARLRAMFDGTVDLATVYPLLVELTLGFTDTPLIIHQRHVELGLRKAGMTPDGLERLEAMLAGQAVNMD